MQAIAVRALPVVETDVPWTMSGARTFPQWVAARAHLTYARAKRVTRLARALRDELPLTAAAVVQGGQGRVSVEAAEILITTAATSAIRRAALIDPDDAGERFLLELAALVAGGPATNPRQTVGRSSGPRGLRARAQGRHRPGVLRRVTHHRGVSPVRVLDHRTQPRAPRRPPSRPRRPRSR